MKAWLAKRHNQIALFVLALFLVLLGRLFLLRRKRRRIDRDGLRLLHLLQLRNQLRVQFYAVPALRTHDDRYHLNRTNAV